MTTALPVTAAALTVNVPANVVPDAGVVPVASPSEAPAAPLSVIRKGLPWQVVAMPLIVTVVTWYPGWAALYADVKAVVRAVDWQAATTAWAAPRLPALRLRVSANPSTVANTVAMMTSRIASLFFMSIHFLTA